MYKRQTTEYALRVAVLNEDDVSECYRQMGRNMLENDLLPHQKNKREYKMKFTNAGRIQLSGPQRSWVDSMLRKFLGDRKVAFFIWTNGLPELFDSPYGDATEHSTMLEMRDTVQNALEWYAALATDLAPVSYTHLTLPTILLV